MIDPRDFLEPGYKLAYSLLREEGSFPPFLVLLSRAGEPRCILPDDGKVESLKRELAERAERERIEVAALFSMGDASFEGEHAPRAVVSVHLEGPGVSRLILTPYEIQRGSLRLGVPMVADATGRLIPGGGPRPRVTPPVP